MGLRGISWGEMAPEGVSAGREAAYTAGALVLSALYSVKAPIRIYREFRAVAPTISGVGQTAVLRSFQEHLGTSLYGFYITAACLLILAGCHFVYCRRAARSYRYRGPAPGRWETAFRCLAVPTAGIFLTFLLALILRVTYAGIFLHYRRELTELVREASGL